MTGLWPPRSPDLSVCHIYLGRNTPRIVEAIRLLRFRPMSFSVLRRDSVEDVGHV
jgi:hypothetical protein